MSVSAVICELNPLHNGHLRVMSEAKSDGSSLVLVMSGNFTQRAGCAICDKYARAKAAVEAGADLVLELPFPYSSAGAEYFAHAGVKIAEAAFADRLVFGSESADETMLYRIADTVASEEYRRTFAEESAADPASGAAAIRSRTLAKMIPGYPADRTEAPNDTLAAEYIRFANIPCVPVKRINTMSASGLRRMSRGEMTPFIPDATARMLDEAASSDQKILRDMLWRHIRINGIPEDTAECGGGLGDRMQRLARQESDADGFFTACATKRYTNSRILRAALFAFLGVTEADLSQMPRITTLLAATSRGCGILSRMRKTDGLRIITKPADAEDIAGDDTAAVRQLDLTRRADELYTMLHSPASTADYFLTKSPYIEK